MSSGQLTIGRLLEFGRVCADTLAYALLVTTILLVVSIIAGVATTGDLGGANVALFVTGWGLVVVATIKLWPRPPDRRRRRMRVPGLGSIGRSGGGTAGQQGESDSSTGEAETAWTRRDLDSLGASNATRFEGLARRLPPLRWMHPPRRTPSPPAKLFVAGVCVLLISFVLEVGFAVE